MSQGLVSHELTAYFSVFYLFLIQVIMAILSGCKPDNFESHKSLKLNRYLRILNSVTDMHGQGLFYKLRVCMWFFQKKGKKRAKKGKIYENLGKIYKIWKYFEKVSLMCNYCMHEAARICPDGLAVYVKEGLSFTWDLSL